MKSHTRPDMTPLEFLEHIEPLLHIFCVRHAPGYSDDGQISSSAGNREKVHDWAVKPTEGGKMWEECLGCTAKRILENARNAPEGWTHITQVVRCMRCGETTRKRITQAEFLNMRRAIHCPVCGEGFVVTHGENAQKESTYTCATCGKSIVPAPPQTFCRTEHIHTPQCMVWQDENGLITASQYVDGKRVLHLHRP